MHAHRQDREVLADVPVRSCDATDAVVLVLVVVPAADARDPGTCVLDGAQAGASYIGQYSTYDVRDLQAV